MRFFQLDGVDPLAAGTDDIARAILHGEEAILVDVSDVTSAQPAVGRELGGGIFDVLPAEFVGGTAVL